MSFFTRMPPTQYSFFSNNEFSTIPDLFRQVKIVEKRLDRHDETINALVNAIECLLDEPEESVKKRRMGFAVEED